MALNLESREGKLLVVIMSEKFRDGGIPIKENNIRGFKSMVEKLRNHYGIDVTVEEIFELGKVAAQSSLKKYLEETEAAIAKDKEKKK
jgi:hypothetical protein